jgi:hypothetical protein
MRYAHMRVSRPRNTTHLDFVRKDGGALLHNNVDVAQGHILDLQSRRKGSGINCISIHICMIIRTGTPLQSNISDLRSAV